jgi:hypothetical protein
VRWAMVMCVTRKDVMWPWVYSAGTWWGCHNSALLLSTLTLAGHLPAEGAVEGAQCQGRASTCQAR